VIFKLLLIGIFVIILFKIGLGFFLCVFNEVAHRLHKVFVKNSSTKLIDKLCLFILCHLWEINFWREVVDVADPRVYIPPFIRHKMLLDKQEGHHIFWRALTVIW